MHIYTNAPGYYDFMYALAPKINLMKMDTIAEDNEHIPTV